MSNVKHFQENTTGIDYVVGDIHGCFEVLEETLCHLNFNPTVDRLFSVGDLVDRGPASEDSLDWLAKPWFHAVRGNHEQMAIDLQTYGEDMYARHNGMGWILDMPKSHQKLYAECFKDLPLAIDITVGDKKYGIVHADVPVGDWDDIEAALDGHNADGYANLAMWGRDRINYKDKSIIKNVEFVYVGHTPLKEVTPLGNVLFIDTGACFKGALTVMRMY